MTVRTRIAILTAGAAVVAAAVTVSGLGSTAISRVGASVLPTRAAAHPSYVDVTREFLPDPGWGKPQGLIPAPDAASPAETSVSTLHDGDRHVQQQTSWLVAGPPPAAASPAPSTAATLRASELSRAGVTSDPGCSGAACGTDGCGFLAPGCALLGCTSAATCGLQNPAVTCDLLNPVCGLDAGDCGLFFTRCGFGDLFGFDRFGFDRFGFDRFRFDRGDDDRGDFHFGRDHHSHHDRR